MLPPHIFISILIQCMSMVQCLNKANLRDLIAPSGLVILNDIQIKFSARGTSKFDRWPRKTIGKLFYAPWNYVCHLVAIDDFKLQLSSRNVQIGAKLSIFFASFHSHLWHDFVAIYEFKLELQSGNAQFVSKPLIFQPVWPWNLTGDLIEK